jgi:ComF family protein
MPPALATRFLLACLPPRCQLCHEPGQPGIDLCAACEAQVPRNRRPCARCGLPLARTEAQCGHCLRDPPPFQRAHVPLCYGFGTERLLPRFKFHQDLAAGRLLCDLALPLARVPDVAAVLPLPLHPARLRQRGYDQSLEVARRVAAACGLPLRTDLLRRVRATAAQSGLDRAARQRNLRGAFTCVGTAPASALLVDDVMTTGATLAAAARALLAAGCGHVEVFALARAALRG